MGWWVAAQGMAYRVEFLEEALIQLHSNKATFQDQPLDLSRKSWSSSVVSPN